MYVKEDQHIIIVVGSGIFFSCDKISVSEHLYRTRQSYLFSWVLFFMGLGEEGRGREKIVV